MGTKIEDLVVEGDYYVKHWLGLTGIEDSGDEEVKERRVSWGDTLKYKGEASYTYLRFEIVEKGITVDLAPHQVRMWISPLRK